MSDALPHRCHVGCAGWSLSSKDADAFPAEGSHLERYAAVFNAVEINSSFYREHKAATYARWAGSVPPHFRFSVKLPRTITHDKRLDGASEELDRFAGQVAALGDKLAWALVQLPPKLAFDEALAQQFLAAAQAALPCPLAMEARHATWFEPLATDLLARHAVTRVAADPFAAGVSVHQPTTPHYYVRLHGSPRVYYSSYDDAYLAQLARAMASHTATGGSAFCIFDNTAGQAAVPNGLALRRLLLP